MIGTYFVHSMRATKCQIIHQTWRIQNSMFSVTRKRNINSILHPSSIHQYKSEYNLPNMGNNIKVPFSHWFLFLDNFVECDWERSFSSDFSWPTLLYLSSYQFGQTYLSRLILHDRELHQYKKSNKLHTHVNFSHRQVHSRARALLLAKCAHTQRATTPENDVHLFQYSFVWVF